MAQHGGAFGVAGGKTLTPSSATEACSVCHGPGRSTEIGPGHTVHNQVAWTVNNYTVTTAAESPFDGGAVIERALADAPALSLLGTAMQRLALSARAYHRVLRVARTIADLAGEECVRSGHVAEAITFRQLDRRVGGALSPAISV
jgi:hypothetical protein